MISTNTSWDTAIATPGRQFRGRFKLNGQILDCAIMNVKCYKGACANYAPGSIFVPYITASLRECSAYLDGAELLYQIGLYIDGDYEYIDIGYFTVVDPKVKTDQVDFTAYGRLGVSGNAEYVSTLTYPATISSILSEIQSQSGLTVTLKGLTASGSVNAALKGTYRDALGIIAGLLGGFVTEDNAGNVVICKFGYGSTVTVQADRSLSLPEFWDGTYTMSGITVVVSESSTDEEPPIPGVSYSAGTPVLEITNEYMTEALFNAMWNNIKNYSFVPADIDLSLGDPRLEAWDTVAVVDLDGVTHNVPCFQLMHEYHGGLSTQVAAEAMSVDGSSVQVTGPVGKAISEVRTIANSARRSANGKNTIYRQASQPTGGAYVEGDVWFDSDDDNKIYRFNGSNWVAVSLGDDALANLSANKITAGTLDASQVTVSNLDAGNITTGVLSADRIGVGSLGVGKIDATSGTFNTANIPILNASKIAVGDYNNYATFNENDPTSVAYSSSVISDGWLCKKTATNSVLHLSPYLTKWCEIGDKYRVTGTAKMDNVGKFYIAILARNANGTSLRTRSTGWIDCPVEKVGQEIPIDGIITIDNNEAWVIAVKSNVVANFVDGNDANCQGYVKNIKVERMSGGELIVDGSITSDHISADKIDADKIKVEDIEIDSAQIASGTIATARIPNLSAAKITSGTLDAARIGANSIEIGKIATATQSQILNSNVLVGGRNLIVNTARPKVSPASAPDTGGVGSAYVSPSPKLTDYGNSIMNNTDDYWTYSFDYKVTGNSSATAYIYAQAKGSQASNPVKAQNVKDKPTGHFTHTFKLTAQQVGAASTYCGIRLREATDGAILTVSNVKLEKGNKETDWSPAPEDTVNSNLLIGSQKMSSWYIAGGSSSTTSEFGVILLNGDASAYSSRLDTKPSLKTAVVDGTPLWLSFEYRANIDTTIVWHLMGTNQPEGSFGNPTRTQYYSDSVTLPTQTSYTKYSIRVPVNNLSDLSYGSGDVLGLAVRIYNRTTDSALRIRKLKLEHGISATDWCPSDEEVQNYVTKIDENGIRIHPSSTINDSVVIDATGMEIFKGGTADANSVAKYGDTARIGKISAGSGNVRTTSTGMDLYVNTTKVGSIYQKTNYTPEYESTAYNNAMFINAAQYFAILSDATPATGGTKFPIMESSGKNELYFNIGKARLSLRDYSNGPASVYLENPDYSRTNQNTRFIAQTEQQGVWLGIGANGTNHGVYSEAGQQWIIAMRGDGVIGGDGVVFSPAIYSNTTSGGANVRVETSGTGTLKRYVSSSRRYKDDIEDLSDEALDPHKLYDARVVQFRYKEDYLDKGDQRHGKLVNGFIAEELEETYPIAVNYEDGLPEDWEPKFLIPPMLKLIQEQHREIEELKTRVEALERSEHEIGQSNI